MSTSASEEPLIAVFVDFENLALGVRDMKSGGFQIQLILKRLLEKGRIVYKRAYCDWSKYRDSVREFHGMVAFLETWAGTLLGGAVTALSRRLFGVDFDFVRAGSTANVYGPGQATPAMLSPSHVGS